MANTPTSPSQSNDDSAQVDEFVQNFSKTPNRRSHEETWIKSYWRPAMGWLYMLICFCDFVLFPALAMFLPALLRGFGVVDTQYQVWQSLTLSNGGLVHIAFGAILGVAAWSRGKEKISGTS